MTSWEKKVRESVRGGESKEGKERRVEESKNKNDDKQ